MKKILIVEDDKLISNLEKDYLEVAGYEVSVEKNGNNGLKAALENDYSLVILDLMLPGMDGFELCKAIRAKKNMPIILVSARGEEIDKIKGLKLGADDYVVKPFSPAELVARVNAHIERYENLTAAMDEADEDKNVIKTGGLVIDKQSRRVMVNGKEATLTNKEFDLLAFLAEHPNVVYSKDDLFDKIWGADSLGETSTVTVHINKIREKIEKKVSDPKYIETVWGIGYRFKG